MLRSAVRCSGHQKLAIGGARPWSTSVDTRLSPQIDAVTPQKNGLATEAGGKAENIHAGRRD
jgi:hypothetical protein